MFVVRLKDEGDDTALLDVAGRVRQQDGYPVWLGESGLAGFLSPPDVLAAWVAVCDDHVVGHVALRSRSTPAAVEVAAERLGVATGTLGFVARLLVDPPSRRRGIGAALLATARDNARARGLVCVLDVLVTDTAAIHLYDDTGWRRVGEVRSVTRDGLVLDELVYAAV